MEAIDSIDTLDSLDGIENLKKETWKEMWKKIEWIAFSRRSSS